MVQVRKRATSVNYAEPKPKDDEFDFEEDEALEEPEPVPVKRKSPAAPRQRKRKTDALEHIEADTVLLSAVLSQSTSITMAAKDWVDRYRVSRGAATAELLTFLLQACGITGRAISSEEVETCGADELKQAADEEAQHNGLEEVATGRSGRISFINNYREMWDKLLREAHTAGCLQDGFLLDKCSNMIIALSTSVVRVLRRIATITASQLSISILHVVGILREAQATAQRQLEAEEKKAKGKAGAARASDFKRTVQHCGAQIQDILDHNQQIFNAVFTHRLRDVDPEIRATVIDGLGHWLLLQPAIYLSQTYLKYVAWGVSDKDASVRLVAVNALLALYSVEGNVAQLTDVTERFTPRFTELVDDVDDDVAVAGVQLVTLLVRHGALPVSAAAHVYRLLGCDSGALRAAAAELVAGMLKERGTHAMQEMLRQQGGHKSSGRTKTKKKGGAGSSAAFSVENYSAGELKLAGMLHMLRLLAVEASNEAAGTENINNPRQDEDEDEEAAAEDQPLDQTLLAMVVDALYDKASDCLGNWRLMLQWLTEDTAADLAGDAGVADLSYCLLWALRKATGSIMPGHADAAPKTVKSAHSKVAKEWNKARHDASVALMQDLPDLVQKYSTDAAPVTALVSLIPELKLDLYTLKAHEKGLVTLLKKVKEIAMKHAEPAVVEACVAALAYCYRQGPASSKDAVKLLLGQMVDTAVKEVVGTSNKLVSAGGKKVQKAIALYRESIGDEEDPLLFSTRSALTHLSPLLALYPEGIIQSKLDQLTASINTILDLASTTTTTSAAASLLPAAITLPAARCALLLLLHRLHTIKQQAAGGEGDEDENENDDENENAPNANNTRTANNPDPAALAELSDAVSEFSSLLERITSAVSLMDNEKDTDGLAIGLASVHADLMMVFSKRHLGPALEDATYQPTDIAIDAFWTACERVLQPNSGSVGDVNGHNNEQQIQKPNTPEKGIEPMLMSKARAAGQVAQIACHGAVPQHLHLAAQLVSHWASAGEEVGEIVKDLIKQIKSQQPNVLPPIILEAMKACYRRCKAVQAAQDLAKATTQTTLTSSSSDDEDEEDEDVSLFEYAELCELIVKWQGSSASPATLAFIVAESAKWAVAGGIGRLDFLHGAYHFMTRLKGKDAEKALLEVEAAAAAGGVPAEDDELENNPDDEEESDWELLYQYMQGLRERAQKGKSNLKKTSSGVGTGAGRKISFVEQDLNEDDDGEEEEEAGLDEEDQADIEALPRQQPGRKQQQQQQQKTRRGSGPTRAAIPAVAEEEISDEEEEDNEEEEEEEVWADAPEVQTDEDDDDDGVMPTAEQLPGLAAVFGGAVGDEGEESSSDEEAEEVRHARRRRKH